MIPLFSANNHELQALTGEKSQFFELIPADLEGESTEDYEGHLQRLETDLNQSSDLLKLYYINGRVYLNTFEEFGLNSALLIPSNSPIKTFLGAEDAQIHFYENYLTQNLEFIRVLSFKAFPEKMYPFDAVNCCDFVMSFKKLPKLHAKNKINMLRKIHFSALFKGMRDLDSENAFKEAENILEKVSSDEASLFQVECFLLVRANTKAQLDEKTTKIVDSFKAREAELRVEERGLSYFYQTLMPGVPASFKRAINCPSDYLSSWVPFHRDFIHEEGLELTSRSKNPVRINIFDSTNLNFNVLITGAAGQGKSMMANRLLAHELVCGTKAMVLDLGNSFSKNARYHEGSILSERFNPLQFKNPRYLKEFILAAIDEKLGKKMEGRLFESIKEILGAKENLNFDELIAHLENDFPGIGFYFSEIREYFCSEFIQIKDFTYCDFGLYPESMKAPLIIYLIECFKNLEGRKIFVFDECWHLLEKNAGYIAECFRTFRKHNAGAVAISQNVDDFSETSLGRVILQNTFTKLLFKQPVRESEFIHGMAKELLDGVQSQKGQYSEFLYLTERNKKPVRYYPSALEYEIFTTDPADTNIFNQYMMEKGIYLSFQKALENFTQLKHLKLKDV